MVQAPPVYDAYLQRFQELAKTLPLPLWLQEMREEAIGRFLDLGFPVARRGNEPWKYTDLRPLAAIPFCQPPPPYPKIQAKGLRQILPWSPRWDVVTMVGGEYKASLSHIRGAQAQVWTLTQSLQEAPSLVEEHLARLAIYHNDAFAALNTALFQDALVVVFQGSREARELHVAFISPPGEGPYGHYPRLLVVVEKGARASLIESYVGLGSGPYLTAAVTEVFLEEGASLEHYRLVMEPEAYHIGQLRVWQDQGSSFHSVYFGRGSRIGRNDVRVELDGPKAEAYLYGLYVTQGQEHLDNYINIDHIKPHGTSRLLYRGILDGASHAIFGGTVYVQPGAIKTDAEQEDKNLLLSREAEVDSKPALEIYADDVRCGHGAAAGAVADEALFYLRSRGLNRELATRLLVKGFATTVLDQIGPARLRSFLEMVTFASLPSLRSLG